MTSKALAQRILALINQAGDSPDGYVLDDVISMCEREVSREEC